MTALRKIYFTDTMTATKRQFETVEPGHAKIYSCGPTVYDYAHIGNFRNFIFVDVLRRTLRLFGYKVTHVINITDIDDKIIKRANLEGIDYKELADRFEKAFFDDCKFLRIERPEHNPRATEHIQEMVDLVMKLHEKGMTYISDGSVYFRISKDTKYGKLSKINLDEVKSGNRVDTDEYDKENARDFVLWKGRKEGEPSWETPMGEGRPGWHLECSAMSQKYLGETFDIHTGAEDLIFPHHENEIAQSENANGKTYVNYWLHCAFLNMKSEKMSKSLGNIVTVRDLSNKGLNPLAIRYFLLSVHYRKPLIFSIEAIEASETAVKRLQGFFRRLLELESELPENQSGINSEIASSYRDEFFQAMADDLNTAKALGSLFTMVREINTPLENKELSKSDVSKVKEFLLEADEILDILSQTEEMLPEEIESLIQNRQQARKDRDFKLADQIRHQLKEKGIVLEDTREGVRWHRE